MVIFDRLQISDNGKLLYIDVHVNKASLFDNIYIDKVIIQTHEQVSEADPLSPGDSYVYQLTADDSTKELHLALNATTDFETNLGTLSDKLLFVYVLCKGTPDSCTPCRLDEMTTLGVTMDETLLHQQVMQYTKELSDTCNVSKGFLDLIMRWNYFKSAIETEHYIPAIEAWKQLFNKSKGKIFGHNNPCGCHG